jgi:glycosyltransferase involved in cell wall biosynthesis
LPPCGGEAEANYDFMISNTQNKSSQNKLSEFRLLILTQKVDKNDDVLGFFHAWIAEFAKHCEKVTVICLGKGEYDLPENVKVLSLGKERESGIRNQESGSRRSLFLIHNSLFKKARYISHFFRYIWHERRQYDTVFVHMNQEYVLLGGIFWKLMGKKITMWRNHYAGNVLTRIAMIFSDKIFCTSKYSFTARSKKTVLMPVGIDTAKFINLESSKIPKIHRVKNSILFLGRIAPSKNLHVFIEALGFLGKQGIDFSANIYGNAAPKDSRYLERIKTDVTALNLDARVHFHNGVPNYKIPEIYNAHEIFVNASPSGMYDKTIFEAMSCEGLVLTSNLNLKDRIDEKFIFKENDAGDLAQKLQVLLGMNVETREKYGKILRTSVVDEQSLVLLAQKLFNQLQK